MTMKAQYIITSPIFTIFKTWRYHGSTLNLQRGLCVVISGVIIIQIQRGFFRTGFRSPDRRLYFESLLTDLGGTSL